MLIQVIYQNAKRFGAVYSSRLDSLIHSGQLFAFRRADAWVVVENGPVRGVGGSYSGPERRNPLPCIENTKLFDGDEDGQDTAENLKADSSESECMKILESYNKL